VAHHLPGLPRRLKRATSVIVLRFYKVDDSTARHCAAREFAETD
jgi:hypothetical protein